MPNRIKELRLAADLTQQELADLVGTTPQQISRLENDERQLTVKWLQTLCPHLGVDWQELAAVQSPGVPSNGEFVHELDELQLLRFWRGLSDEEKVLFVRRGMPPPVQTVIKRRRRGPLRKSD